LICCFFFFFLLEKTFGNDVAFDESSLPPKEDAVALLLASKAQRDTRRNTLFSGTTIALIALFAGFVASAGLMALIVPRFDQSNALSPVWQIGRTNEIPIPMTPSVELL
jgi:hypothetical protein